MSFVLFQLATHPEIQDRVREEIKTVLARHDNKITYDSIGELIYMGQVIDETFRMFSPATTLIRQCVKDYKVPGEDVVIEKGTITFVSIKGIHYDEDYHKNPQLFDPDRFNEVNKEKMNQYAHLPFGQGPRTCIGERFGLMQVKVGLISLLRNFKVSLNEKTVLPITISPRGVVTTAEGGVWLNIEKTELKSQIK